jgi:lincosamide nucleotidyltransferase A/C/D/E
MKASAVCELVAQLETLGTTVWLDGGWGIDALLGHQTRPHHDLDLIVRIDDVPRLLDACRLSGFAVRDGAPPHAFVLRDALGRELDVHTVAFHTDGTATHRIDSGNDWVFPSDSFSGTGMVGGVRVMCLSAAAQVLCHAQGYRPTDKDFRDMAALAKAFGVELPPALRRAGPAHGGIE